jgi:ribosomal protein S18 acetylase RimI-like enzyme
VTRIEYAIRQMDESDLPAVAAVEASVFTDWYTVHRRDSRPLPRRTLDELRFSTSFDPAGNFVAIAAEGALVGFILSRTWGELGWFGTFGVATQLQGSGIGRALVDRTMEYLRREVSIIGLETMPESGANIGLYTKMGFVPTYPTIMLELPLIDEASRLKGVKPEDVVVWPPRDRGRRRTLGEVREISEALVPGLDYGREIEKMSEHGLGETILSAGKGGRVDGFAVLRLAPFREEAVSGQAYIHILAIRPGCDEEAVLLDLLSQTWARATGQGLSRMITGVSGRYQRAVALLLENGFRALRAAVVMIHREAPAYVFEPSPVINLCRWAG